MIRIRSIAAIALLHCSHSMGSTLLQVEGPILSERLLGSVPAARGEDPDRFNSLSLPSESKAQIDFDSGNTMEIHGPAYIKIDSYDYFLELGEFFFVEYSDERDSFVLGEEFYSSDASFWVSVSAEREYAQIILFRGDLRIAGQDLESETLYLLNRGSLQKTAIDDQRLNDIRRTFAFSTPYLERIQKDEKVVSYRHYFALIQNVGVNKVSSDNFEPAKNNTIEIAPGMEFFHKRYLNFPEVPTRHLYLRAPAIRLGVGLTTGFNTLNLNGSEEKGISTMAKAFVGLSWLGLSVAAELDYALLNPSTIVQSPKYLWGFRAQYEVDLLKYTKSNLSFNFGYTMLRQDVTAGLFGPFLRMMHKGHIALAFIF